MDLQERRSLVFECLDRPNGFKLSLSSANCVPCTDWIINGSRIACASGWLHAGWMRPHALRVCAGDSPGPCAQGGTRHYHVCVGQSNPVPWFSSGFVTYDWPHAAIKASSALWKLISSGTFVCRPAGRPRARAMHTYECMVALICNTRIVVTQVCTIKLCYVHDDKTCFFVKFKGKFPCGRLNLIRSRQRDTPAAWIWQRVFNFMHEVIFASVYVWCKWTSLREILSLNPYR